MVDRAIPRLGEHAEAAGRCDKDNISVQTVALSCAVCHRKPRCGSMPRWDGAKSYLCTIPSDTPWYEDKIHAEEYPRWAS